MKWYLYILITFFIQVKMFIGKKLYNDSNISSEKSCVALFNRIINRCYN